MKLWTGQIRDAVVSAERFQRRLLGAAIALTVLLSLVIAALSWHTFAHSPYPRYLDTRVAPALVALVLLLDACTIYNQLLIRSIGRWIGEREELFRLISENAADMIAVVDGKGRRIYNSPAYQKILGYTAEELKATSPFDRIHPADRPKVIAAAAKAQRTHDGQSIEYRIQHKDGSWRVIESTASTALNERGGVEKLIIVNRDVTERQHLQTRLLQAQKMEAVGRLSGGVAHDFNNLLGVIIGYAEILSEPLAERPALRGYVEQILKAGRQAATLTRQLLAFSRQQVLEPKVLNVSTIVLDTEKMLQRLIGEDIVIQTHLEERVGRVCADEAQLQQAIINLAVNARDALPNGGCISIETENHQMTELSVQQYSYPVRPGPYVRLSVKDNGVGMDAETQAKIFEPFFTTKEKGKGTGLGLAMVYGFVKQSGGYIEVASEGGVGTTFHIYLPLVQETVAVEAKPQAAPANSFEGSESILLVEDETSLRELARHFLQALGYKVLAAGNAASAMRISDSYNEPIDLLITDVVMPGLNGRLLADRLRKRRPAMGVLFMSGYTGQTVGAHGVLAEGSFFIAKPFMKDNLARKVREVIGATRALQSPDVAALHSTPAQKDKQDAKDTRR
jgi:two-component system, cell cycle sensor histidine kinase and response regulator CckA